MGVGVSEEMGCFPSRHRHFICTAQQPPALTVLCLWPEKIPAAGGGRLSLEEAPPSLP